MGDLRYYGLIALFIVVGGMALKIQQYRASRANVLKETADVPVEERQRRVKRWSLAGAASMVLYGVWKVTSRSVGAAIFGIEGYGTVPGIYRADLQGDYLAFAGTLAYGAIIFVVGIVLLRSMFAHWLAVGLIALEFFVLMGIGLAYLGDSSIGDMYAQLLLYLLPPGIALTVLFVSADQRWKYSLSK